MSGRNKLDLIIILVLKLGNDISITHLLNVCINRGSGPEEWKRAKVTPVYKYGSHEDPSNYRPISILPVLSKLLERAVNGQLYEHLFQYSVQVKSISNRVHISLCFISVQVRTSLGKIDLLIIIHVYWLKLQLTYAYCLNYILLVLFCYFL